MGKFLKFIGIAVLIIGVIFGFIIGFALYDFYYDGIAFVIAFLPTLIISAVLSAVLFTLGNIYDVTLDTNDLLHKVHDGNSTIKDNK